MFSLVLLINHDDRHGLFTVIRSDRHDLLLSAFESNVTRYHIDVVALTIHFVADNDLLSLGDRGLVSRHHTDVVIFSVLGHGLVLFSVLGHGLGFRSVLGHGLVFFSVLGHGLGFRSVLG